MKEMIKQKMLKLHRRTSSSLDKTSSFDKSSGGGGDRDRVEFVFSKIHAVKVPVGWDKLSVSLVSVETGKTICKTGKATARNGACRWAETLSECLSLSRENVSKELEQYLYKLVVSTGSSRAGILGEATVNLADHMSSETSYPVAVPLKKCNYGTILQVEIQCLTPRTSLRNERWNDTSFAEDSVAYYDEMDNNLDVPDSKFSNSIGSSSSNNFFSPSHSGGHGSRDTSFSALVSQHSFDSMEDSLGREIGLRSPCRDSPRSIHSPNSGSGKRLNNQREDTGQISHTIPASPLQNAGSSEFLLEADGVTVGELRAEARMWEKNARKLMLDLDFSRKESADQAKQLANLDVEFCALQTECDALRREIKQLKFQLDESSVENKDNESVKLRVQHKNDELEEEIRFQKVSIENLALQLQKSQDSNVELVSVLQELEETIEEQKVEIESLSIQRLDTVGMGMQYSYGQKDSGEVSTCEKGSAEKAYIVPSNIDLESTILSLEKTLADKCQEIEIERDLMARTLSDQESEWRSELTLKENEILSLEAKLSEVLAAQDLKGTESEARQNLDLIKEIEALKEKVQDLERDCNELTDENLELLFKLKESGNALSMSGTSTNSSSYKLPSDSSPCTEESESSKLEFQIWQLKEEIKKRDIDGVATGYLQNRCNELDNTCSDQASQLQALNDKACYLESELNRSRARIEEQEIEIASLNQELEGRKDLTMQKEQPEVVMKLHGDDVQCCEEQIKSVTDLYVVENDVEDDLKEYISCSGHELEAMNKELESKVEDMGKELMKPSSEIEVLKMECLLKQEEIEAQLCSRRDLETQVSDLQKIISQMQESSETMHQEGKITSQCLDSLRNDMLVLSSSLDSHISLNKILEGKLLELENCKLDLEQNVTELEHGNVYSFERISELETQLKILTDEREANHMEVQHSESHVKTLQSEIRRLETEMESQKADTRQKLQDMQKCWLEAQEACECLRQENTDLQSTAENLREECTSLQRSNGELGQQRLEIQKKYFLLEAELRDSKNISTMYSKKLEGVEEKFSGRDTLLLQNKEHKENLVSGESLSSQMFPEKVVEIENLHEEATPLGGHRSIICDERDRMATDSVLDMKMLQEGKDALEIALKEVQGKLESSEKQLDVVRGKYETEIFLLTNELGALKLNHEALVAKNEKLVELMDNTRSNEENLKHAVNHLELKLKSSEHEKLQLKDEISSLKTQLQKIPLLQGDVLTLKSVLDEMKFANQRLEASLELISGDYKDLKEENGLLLEKTLGMRKAMLDLEDYRRSKVSLEEKLLCLEGDLTEKEAICAQQAEMENELRLMKQENSQLHWKIHSLQQEKEECLKKAEILEEELKQMKEAEQSHDELSVHLYSGTNGDVNEDIKLSETGSSQEKTADNESRIHLLENELAEALEANDMYKKQLQSLFSEGTPANSESPTKLEVKDEAFKKENTCSLSLLEAELCELRERYLDMSLKYAEVEAQREQLVLKLKVLSNGRN